MSNESIRQEYSAQRAPAAALPEALQRFSESPRNRRAYWLPSLAGALLVALWFAVPLSEIPLSQENQLEPIAEIAATPGLGALSLPSPPTMPRLAALSMPSGDLVIPRISQISMKTNPPEKE